jgi:hypothetical protein
VTYGAGSLCRGEVFRLFDFKGEKKMKKARKKKSEARIAKEKMKSEIDKLKNCNFEELREGFIDVSKHLIEIQFTVLDLFETRLKEIKKVGLQCVKQVRMTNDKDFKIAEKNFKAINNQLDVFNDKLSQVAAASVVSLMRSVAVSQKLYKQGTFKGEISEEKVMKLLPVKVKKIIASTMDMKLKDLETLIKSYGKAA